MNTTVSGLRNRNKILIHILFLILFASSACSTHRYDRINHAEVKKIKIVYLEKMLETQIAIDEFTEIFRHYDMIRFADITDSLFIRKFVKEINKLKVSKDSVIYDFRVCCVIGSPQNRLTLGGSWTTVFNGQLMKDSKKIFRMLDKLLYAEEIKQQKESLIQWKKERKKHKKYEEYCDKYREYYKEYREYFNEYYHYCYQDCEDFYKRLIQEFGIIE